MADIIEQAVGEIIVRDSTSQGVKSATANFQQLYDVVRYNWWGIQNLGTAFAGLGATLAVGLGEATKAAVEFDQGLTQVGRTADLSGQDLDKMGKALRELALEKPINVGVLSKIAADAGALGIQGVDNIKAFTGTIADLISTTDLTEESAVQLARLGGVLGLQGEDWQRLGSAILYAGVNSAATEKDIVNMAVRLSGAGAAAHLTAAEIIALSATATSLGSSPQVAATSLNRAIQQIAKSAATGKPNLLEFAKVAGYDGPNAARDFARAFNTDAAGAIAQFVTGLGRMHGNTIAVNKVLIDLGFTGQRGAQTLLQLAAGTQQNVNPMLNLNNSLKLTQQAWERNNELQKQAQEIYGSTANQLKITENAVHDIAIGFGDTLLPALNAVLKPLLAIIWGFDSLPGPVKEALAVVGLLGAGLLLLVGSAIALAPRLILMAGSYKELKSVMMGLGDTAKVTMTALRASAASEEEAAAVSIRSATAMSRADRERAVAAYQAATATDIKAIADRGAAEAEALATAGAARRAQAAEATAVAVRAQVEADALLAQAEAAAAKGLLAEAAALEENALAKQLVADESAVAAAESRALAAALAEDAVAAQAAAAEEMAAYEAAIALQVGEEEATGASYALGLAMDTMLGPIGIAIAVISALAIGLGFLGGAHHKAAQEAQQEIQANTQLADIIRKTGQAAGQSVQMYYYQSAAFLAAATAAQQYGIQSEKLLSIILGTANAQQTQAFYDDLKQRYEAGDAAAGQLYNSTRNLALGQKAAADAAGIQADYEKKTGKSLDDVSNSANLATDSLAKLKAAHDAINNAVLDLPDALLGVRQAEEQVTQAQQALSDAQNSGVKHAEDIAKAEADLTQARLDQRKAQEDLVAAEKRLANARAEAAQAVIDAQNKLADDNDKLLDTQDKIAELEAKIAAEREGPSVRDITEATNKLADANIKLLNSQKKVGDAQYMLNYLMAEGASQRDIQDAQDELAAAQQEVADNTLAVSDAQANLNKVQAGADPVQLAKDERDLAAAQRELQDIQRQLVEDTANLKQAQDDLASDKAYKEAQDALQEAQLRLTEANYKVIDSADALHKVMRENPADKVKEAQIELESALLNLAKAHVRVTQDTAIMNGEQFGAGRQARALADELDKLGIKAAGPVGDHLKTFSAILRNSVKDINDADTAVSNFGGGAKPIQGPVPTFVPTEDLGKSASGGIGDSFKAHAKDIAAGLLIALGIAFAIVVGGVPGLIIGLLAALIGAIVLAISHWGPQIGHAFGVAFGAIQGAVMDVVNWLEQNWPLILAILTGPFGLLIYWLHDNWGQVTGAISTAIDWLHDHWPLILAILTGPFGLLIYWLANHWSEVTGFVRKPFDWVASNWHNILGYLTSPFSSAIGWIEENFVRMLNWFLGLPGLIGNKAAGMFHWVADAFLAPLRFIQSMWNELWEWLGSKSFSVGGLSVLGHTVIPSFGFDFGFLKNLEFHIPGLAEGGIVLNPTLVAAGEKGAEAIMPLDKMMHMFEPIDALALEMHAVAEALTALVALQEGHGGSASGDTFNINGADADPMDIAREVVWQKKVRLH